MEWGASWKDKPLDGMHQCQIKEVADIGQTYQLLIKAELAEG